MEVYNHQTPQNGALIISKLNFEESHLDMAWWEEDNEMMMVGNIMM
jgi:hypothetical protein